MTQQSLDTKDLIASNAIKSNATLNRKLVPNDLEVGSRFYITGKIFTSRIASKIDGKELEDFQKNAKYPPNGPFNQIKLTEPTVLAVDPENPTLTELYGRQRCYSSAGDDDTVYFEIRNAGKYNPRVFYLTGEIEGTTGRYMAIPVELEAELARGTEVILVVEVFKGKGNNGVSVNDILLKGPIKYYSPRVPDPDIFAPVGVLLEDDQMPEFDPKKQQKGDKSQVSLPGQPEALGSPETDNYDVSDPEEVQNFEEVSDFEEVPAPENNYQSGPSEDFHQEAQAPTGPIVTDRPQPMTYDPHNDPNRQY